MLNAIQPGILTPSTKSRLEQLEAQRDALKASIVQAQIERPQYSKEQIVAWISRFKYRSIDDPAYQKEIIDIFVNAVYVFDDKLVFTYNFKDGSQTITLDDIKAAFGSDLEKSSPPGKKRPQTLRSLLLYPFRRVPPHTERRVPFPVPFLDTCPIFTIL